MIIMQNNYLIICSSIKVSWIRRCSSNGVHVKERFDGFLLTSSI